MTPHPLLNTGLALMLGLVAAVVGDEPAGPPAPGSGVVRPPVFIVLDPAEGSGLGMLLDRLREPDFVLLDGRRYSDLIDAARRAAAVVAPPAEPTADSVTITGALGGEVARLTIRYRFILTVDGSRSVPLRLDGGQVLTSVREGRRELRPRSEGGSWRVDLDGQGPHEVEVALQVPIRSVPEGRRIEVAIPEAATTRVDLEVPGSVAEAKVDGDEPVAVEALEGQERSRISASLTPRPRLELTWRSGAFGEKAGPALITALGNLAVDVEPGSLRIAASYELRAERGEARTLAFELDQADELIAVELDGQAISTGEARVGEEFAFALPQPLQPGTSRKLTITARRPLPVGGPTRTTLRGFPLRDVAVQSGLIAVAQSGSLSVGGGTGHALRRVDPRSELPAALRVRPSNVLAYQFFDQPFELELQIDPSPPWVRVESRTTVSLASRLVRVETWLDYQIARGRVFEVRVALPPGLRLDSAGPDRWVASAERAPEPQNGGGSVLTLTLTDAARQAGEFELHLTGRQDVEPDGLVPVGLFRPLEVTTQGGHIAVLTARDVTAELAESSHVVPADTEVPASWRWPERRTGAEVVPSLWLIDDGDSSTLPLRAKVHKRAIRSQTTLDALIDRRRAEVRQETLVSVDYGTLTRLDVAIPSALEGRWESEGVEVTRREPLGPSPNGDPCYRLFLAREVADQVRLRFRVRFDLEHELGDRERTPVTLLPITLLEGEAEPTTVRVAADPGIRLEPEGPGWSPEGQDLAAEAKARDETPVRLIRSGPEARTGPAVVLASAHALAELPSVVASRLWLRMVREPDGSIKASASYRLETHRGELAFALPSGAEPRLVHVGETVLSEVERLPEPSSFRLRFPPSTPTGPVSVRIEFDLPERDSSTSWEAPRLLRGGVVQRSFWEIRLPWRDTMVGVPSGWSDENRWVWDAPLWARRPRYSTIELADWAGDPRAALDLSPAAMSGSDSHGYLFSRPGEPRAMRAWVISRAALVAGASGLALAIGLTLLIWRPPGRLAGLVASGALLALGASWHPSVLILMAQSASLGVMLTLLAWAMQWVVELRFRDRRHAFPESAEPTPIPSNGSATADLPSSQNRNRAIEEAPEGSTVIRPRSTSPMAPARSSVEDRAPGDGGGGP